MFLSISCQNINSVREDKCVSPILLDNILADYVHAGQPLAKIKLNEPLNPEWVQKDFQVLRLILEEANPNIYRYASETEMDSLFEATLCQLNDPIYYIDFVRHIATVFNKMACGHSGWSHTDDFKRYRKDSMTFFPLDIISQNNRYFVTRNNSFDSTIFAGSEILSINNMKPDSINKILRSHMNRDGSSAPHAEGEISTYFRNAYSNFVANPDTFHVVIKDTLGRANPVQISAQSKASLDDLSKYDHKQLIKKPLSFAVDSVLNTATYSISSFRNELIEQQGQNFNLFTDSVFQVVNDKKLDNLIIDLRGNSGGWTANGKKLFSFFIQDAVSYIRTVELSLLDSFSFQPLIISDQGIEDTMLFDFNKNNLYEWSNYPNLMANPSLKNSFKGSTFILIDEGSKSCASAFSSMMRSHTDAIFIGEENGASQCGSGGMVLMAILPYTGITVGSSTAKYTYNVADNKNSRGIMVDYTIQNDIFSELKSKDQQIEFIFDLIKKRTTE